MSFQNPDAVSAIPLISLRAVVIDTETTGLDIENDRIIQIGAVRISGARIDAANQFNHFVAPGVPIPAESTSIHGIRDADIRDADNFTTVMERFAWWCGPVVVIGFSVGFDLAVLKAEHKRAGIKWQPPRSLDVRHLVHYLSPNLPEYSLDMIAEWLGVDVEGRHSALGDAVMTAKIFAALIPRLQERGISTLAEAKRRCRALTSQIDTEVRAGWHEVVSAREAVARSVSEYARIDSYPYRHRVRDIMHSPPQIIDHETSLQSALTVMMRERVSSVFVSPEEPDGAYGIVTERDVLRAVDAYPSSALSNPVSRIAQRPLVCVPQDEFLYRAIGMMSAGNYRHLGVSGDQKAPVGALSARDLLRQRASDALSLGDNIQTAHTPEDLGVIWVELTTVVRGLVYEEVDARDIAAVISRELRALTARACEIAERELAEQGNPGPPVAYAMLVLGSGGRGESLLAMDQDNAVVYAQGGRDSDVDKWFAALGQRVADILNLVGVAYCDGGIMAANAQWRMQVSDWREMIKGWIGRSRPEDILNCDIFFDSVPVHGDLALGQQVRADALPMASATGNFLKMLTLNAADFQVPLGWFGRMRLDAGRIDLKKGGILPIFSTARVLALRHGLRQRSTPERLTGVRDKVEVGDNIIDNLIDAHRILMAAILAQQLRDLETGITLSNKVDPEALSAKQREELKWALEQLNSIPDLLGNPIILS